MSPPISLLLDFDGTITTTDTLSLVASIGYSKNASQALPPWSHFSAAYLADYAAHKASYTPQLADRRTLAQEVAWLESLKPIERASVERVEAAGIFANVTAPDVHAAASEAAREVPLRSGLRELVRLVGSVSVISVNWSAAFVLRFLRTVIPEAGWNVVANEIEGGEKARLNRHLGDEGIWTAGGKARVLRGLLDGKGRSVYVGDSLTDLECLMLVDVGICVRDGVMGREQVALSEALDRVGIECRWIGKYREATGKQNKTVLWWANDFRDIAESDVFRRAS